MNEIIILDENVKTGLTSNQIKVIAIISMTIDHIAWAFWRKKGIGFGISDIAITEAKELASISNLNTAFFRTIILDIDDSYKNGLDYVGQTNYEAKECYWYIHKISDIINSIVSNGLEIEEIEEYNLKTLNNAKPSKNMKKFPLNYMLYCRKQKGANYGHY